MKRLIVIAFCVVILLGAAWAKASWDNYDFRRWDCEQVIRDPEDCGRLYVLIERLIPLADKGDVKAIGRLEILASYFVKCCKQA